MTRRSTGSRWTGAILSMALLAGCAPGLMGGDNRTDPALDRILVSDSDVPTKQGLLFMAMQDAEVARQSAGFALAAPEAADAKAQINNLLYAIDPEFPPTPTVTASGVTPFWPPTGYGLRHSMQDIAEEMRGGQQPPRQPSGGRGAGPAGHAVHRGDPVTGRPAGQPQPAGAGRRIRGRACAPARRDRPSRPYRAGGAGRPSRGCLQPRGRKEGSARPGPPDRLTAQPRVSGAGGRPRRLDLGQECGLQGVGALALLQVRG